MCMDFHDLVNSERELEEKGEKLLEKKSEVESRIDLLEKAVQKLSDDIQISGVLQNREQQTKEEKEESLVKITQFQNEIDNFMEQIQEEMEDQKSSKSTLQSLEEMGEDVSDGKSILKDREEAMLETEKRLKDLAQKLGLQADSLLNSEKSSESSREENKVEKVDQNEKEQQKNTFLQESNVDTSIKSKIASFFEQIFPKKADEIEDSNPVIACSRNREKEFRERYKVDVQTNEQQKTKSQKSEPTKTPVFKEIPVKEGRVPSWYSEKIDERHTNSEYKTRTIFDYVKQFKEISVRIKDVKDEYYDKKSNTLYLNLKQDKQFGEKTGTGFYHEFGHAADAALGGNQYLSNDEQFLAVLKADYKDILKRYSTPEAAEQFLKDLDQPVSYSVSDLVEGLSKGKIRGGYGHLEGDSKYWDDKYAVCNEAFAHFFEASMGDKERLEKLKESFPNSYNYYLKMISPFVVSESPDSFRERERARGYER